MSWSDWRSFPKSPKRPPPAHGIKMKKAGVTWWGQRWIEALEEVLGGDSGRLARGRTYARAGRTHDLVVESGKASAKVTGSRPTPYTITIALTALPEATWKKAIAGMAAQARFAAELLAGQMPLEIDEVFCAAGSSLFPTQRKDLVTSCSCPDWGDPCKHVAATHYVLGEALDRDPFLLFELRGRGKTQVLDALRLVRGGEVVPARKRGRAATKVEPATPEVATVSLEALAPGDYERAPAALPALRFSFEAPLSHGALLRQLGAPAGWDGEQSPAETLSSLVRGAAETARRLAMAEPAGSGEVEPVKQPTPRPRRR